MDDTGGGGGVAARVTPRLAPKADVVVQGQTISDGLLASPTNAVANPEPKCDESSTSNIATIGMPGNPSVLESDPVVAEPDFDLVEG